MVGEGTEGEWWVALLGQERRARRLGGHECLLVYPKQKWTRSIKRAVDKGAEFYLERKLHKHGARYAPWFRFHYPTHYYYDILVGLDFMTALGYSGDTRLQYAVRLLKAKRRGDGKWNMDAIHPDVEGGVAEWFKKHPKNKPTPVSLEQVRKPSKMITLKALLVLKRVDEKS